MPSAFDTDFAAIAVPSLMDQFGEDITIDGVATVGIVREFDSEEMTDDMGLMDRSDLRIKTVESPSFGSVIGARGLSLTVMRTIRSPGLLFDSLCRNEKAFERSKRGYRNG
jgi:hypothetical protein